MRIISFILTVFLCLNACVFAYGNSSSDVESFIRPLEDKYNPEKDYFDYSLVLTEFPKNYYYTTIKIRKRMI